jgi:hypothetical protein
MSQRRSDDSFFEQRDGVVPERRRDFVPARRVHHEDSFNLFETTDLSPKSQHSAQSETPPPRMTFGSRKSLMVSMGSSDDDGAAERNVEHPPSPPPVAVNRELLHEYYLTHNPAMISNAAKLADSFKDRGRELSANLEEKYGESLAGFAERKSKAAASPNGLPEAPHEVDRRTTVLNTQRSASFSERPQQAEAPSLSSPPDPTALSPRRSDLSAREALELYFRKYNPANLTKVDAILEQFNGDVTALSALLERKYGAPLYSVTREVLGGGEWHPHDSPAGDDAVPGPGAVDAQEGNKVPQDGNSPLRAARAFTSPPSQGRPRAANTAPFLQSPSSASLHASPRTALSTTRTISLSVAEQLEREREELQASLAACKKKQDELLLAEEALKREHDEHAALCAQQKAECDSRERLLTKLEESLHAKETDLRRREAAAEETLASAKSLDDSARITEQRAQREFVEAFHRFDVEKRAVLQVVSSLTSEVSELQDLARRLHLTVADANARFSFRSSVLRDLASTIELKHRESLAIEACSLFPVASAQYDRVEIFGKLLVAAGLLSVLLVIGFLA